MCKNVGLHVYNFRVACVNMWVCMCTTLGLHVYNCRFACVKM